MSLALVAAACGSSGKSTGSSPTTAGGSSGTAASKFNPNGTFTLEIDQEPTNFNCTSSDGNEEACINIVDRVWPSVFHTLPNYTTQLDSNFMLSATQTSSNPQTILYHINPKAVWSDGVPITYKDFVYSYQAQSGLPQYKDVGGKAFAPASTSGYSQIKTIGEYNNDPYQVQVVFSTPYPDWKGLFGADDPVLPAHIAQTVPYNDGFTDPVKDLVSGGPFMVSNYNKGTSLTLVRNPKYWGPPANLASVTFRFLTDSSQIVPALQNNEINGGILTPQLDLVNSLKQLSGVTYSQKDGLEFEHLDFNETNKWLKDPAIRQAIMLAVDRKQLIAKTVGQFDSTVTPLENHVLVPGQPGYQDNSGGLYSSADIAKAKSVLQAAGYTLNGGQLTKGGQAVTMRISSTAGNALRSSEEQFVINSIAPLGIKATETDVSSLGDALSKGNFDMIIFAWVNTPFLSGNDAIYQTANTSTGAGSSNYDGYSDPTVDKLITQADNTLDTTARTAIYNQVDAQLWKTFYNLPLFQRPVAIVYQNKYVNFQVNATAESSTYNMEQWAEKA
ncbi:ABC transporter family substrate-binding protein [Acidiferrimicrobium sp. IK]|uniref:ABC transporter family substrate-binding protein n=1 Tax=Acidiferrimicrobium sp. IK TaxID=2871700 RepID=UPI0021CAEDD2|nr:ABC transporter family substrate-binding protein [Acidiferrimicrobium sp. IK]MCU4183531.1 ABC transporter family substrate-binding protein [Acidiferrimicrobium sp. IK]